LDGSRGIDFTSPHGGGDAGLGGGIAGVAELPQTLDRFHHCAGGTGISVAHDNMRADPKERQLIAYVTRLLARKQLLLAELKKICSEAEFEVRMVAAQLSSAAVYTGKRVIPAAAFAPAPVRFEVSAAQQRVLGAVPLLPHLPPIRALLSQLCETAPIEAVELEGRTKVWRQEVGWLQEELRGTARTLDSALAALRPTAQRFSMALGATAPEPLSRGLGMALCADTRDEAGERAHAMVSATLAEGGGSERPSPAHRDLVAAAGSLLLQLAAWASAPSSAVECRQSLRASLQRLHPPHDGNSAELAALTATLHKVQALLSGADASLSATRAGGAAERLSEPPASILQPPVPPAPRPPPHGVGGEQVGGGGRGLLGWLGQATTVVATPACDHTLGAPPQIRAPPSDGNGLVPAGPGLAVADADTEIIHGGVFLPSVPTTGRASLNVPAMLSAAPSLTLGLGFAPSFAL
jgi:hypothetical protein